MLKCLLLKNLVIVLNLSQFVYFVFQLEDKVVMVRSLLIIKQKSNSDNLLFSDAEM